MVEKALAWVCPSPCVLVTCVKLCIMLVRSSFIFNTVASTF